MGVLASRASRARLLGLEFRSSGRLDVSRFGVSGCFWVYGLWVSGFRGSGFGLNMFLSLGSVSALFLVSSFLSFPPDLKPGFLRLGSHSQQARQ